MYKLEIVFMKHCAPIHLLVDKDGALYKKMIIQSLNLLVILLTILYPLTQFGAPCYNIFFEIIWG